MTVQSSQARVTYVGDATSLSLAVPFLFYTPSDVVVVQTNAQGIERTLVFGTDYTLSGAGNATGGTLVLALPVPNDGSSLNAFLNPALTQLTHYVQGQVFPSSSIETNFDRITQMVQRVADQISRSIVKSDGDAAGQLTLPPAAVRANTQLAFDAFGNLSLTALSAQAISTALLAPFLNLQQTFEESIAGVNPVNVAFPFLHPNRYGALGDGASDDTLAMAVWVKVINATPAPTSVWDKGRTYLCGPLPAISANDFTLMANGSVLKVQANSWLTSGDGSTHLNFTGSGTRIAQLTVDGNQSKFLSGAVGRLIQFGNDCRFVSCTFKNSAGQGMRTGAIKGQFLACRFNSNANLGAEISAAAYLKFDACEFTKNGYGLNGVLNLNGPVGTAFGVALRFRSHHLSFTACDFSQNGLDGVTTGQGSYAIKYIGCVAWQNNDSGFTLNNNSTAGGPGVGPSGDGEGPFDIEYLGCEAYGNWGSGLASYAAATNVTVEGGRYYNNWRGAGILTLQSSIVNGIYFAAGSLGINVRTKAYDDRQLSGITAALGTSPCVLTLTGWVAGTAGAYPRVALYDSAMNFKGYATIVSEAANTISITSTSANGVNLAAIIFGWNVSQRVQHNGVFLDNGCQGLIDVDGFGQLPGPQPYMGFKSICGYNAGGQNVTLPSAQLDYTELLVNPGFETDESSWTFSIGAGGSHSRITAGNIRSTGAEQMVGGSSADTHADATLIATAANFVQNCYVELSGWVFSPSIGGASLTLFWNPGTGVLPSTVQHPGGGWHFLRVGAFIPAGWTQLFPRILSVAGVTSSFDNLSLRVKADADDNRNVSYPTRNLAV